MGGFVSKWLPSMRRTDETDKTASVSSVSAKSGSADGNTVLAPAQSMPNHEHGGGGEGDVPGSPPEKRADRTDRSTSRPIPSRCIAPRACPVLGICGREDCLAAEEWVPFAAAMVAARVPGSPHGVPDFYPDAHEEADHAA